MRGHEALIEMRRDKKRPQGIWITQNPSIDCMKWDKNVETLPYPEIEILPNEIPESLDLRYVVGMTVHVCGATDYKKAKRLHAALVEAGASRVITDVNGLLIDSELGESSDYVPE
jgi:hypothetical protein